MLQVVLEDEMKYFRHDARMFPLDPREFLSQQIVVKGVTHRVFWCSRYLRHLTAETIDETGPNALFFVQMRNLMIKDIFSVYGSGVLMSLENIWESTRYENGLQTRCKGCLWVFSAICAVRSLHRLGTDAPRLLLEEKRRHDAARAREAV